MIEPEYADPLDDQWHAMVTPETGDLFYPDNKDDADWFAEQHGAEPVFAGVIRAEMGQHVLCRRFPCGAADCEHAA